MDARHRATLSHRWRGHGRTLLRHVIKCGRVRMDHTLKDAAGYPYESHDQIRAYRLRRSTTKVASTAEPIHNASNLAPALQGLRGGSEARAHRRHQTRVPQALGRGAHDRSPQKRAPDGAQLPGRASWRCCQRRARSGGLQLRPPPQVARSFAAHRPGRPRSVEPLEPDHRSVLIPATSRRTVRAPPGLRPDMALANYGAALWLRLRSSGRLGPRRSSLQLLPAL